MAAQALGAGLSKRSETALEGIALLRAVYDFTNKSHVRRQPLWQSVARELRWLLALLPVFVARCRLAWSPVVTAVDASPWGFGTCEQTLSAAEVGDVELITKLLAKGSNDGDFNPVRHATGQIGAGRVSRHTVSRQNPPSQVTPTQP